MAIVINGSGTVTGLAVGGLPDGTVDSGTLATNSVDSAELIDGSIDTAHIAANQITTAIMPTGSVLQVVVGELNSTAATSSTSFVDSGLSASITPRSTASKILVTFNAGGINKSAENNQCISFKLIRGSTHVHGGANVFFTGTGFGISGIDAGFTHLDSPSTASAVTYKITFKARIAASVSMATGGEASQGARLILTEIAG